MFVSMDLMLGMCQNINRLIGDRVKHSKMILNFR